MITKESLGGGSFFGKNKPCLQNFSMLNSLRRTQMSVVEKQAIINAEVRDAAGHRILRYQETGGSGSAA